MKNQIKITLALLVMLTLNACGTAPITVNPDNSGDDKKTSAICTTNPFDASCGDAFQAERDVVIGECRINGSDDSCLSATASVCRTNPFDVLCSFTFDTARNIITTECRKDDTGTLCPQAIARVCLANPFDELCGDDYENARDVSITRCRLNSGIGFANSCPQVVTKVCGENPFDSFCDDNDTYEPARIADCIIGDNAGETRCTGAFQANSCVLNPFGAGCDMQAPARAMRESFCRQSGNSTNAVCTGAVLHFCTGSAFDGLCDNNTTYEPMRIADCIIAGNAGETRCTGAFTTGSCVLNPFGANCDSESYLAEARVNRVNFCSADKTGSNLCTQVISDCLLNPFGASCSDNSFENARASRITLCSDSQTSGDNLCMNINACHINPFGAGCFADTTYDVSRNQRINFCGVHTNKDDDICAVALARPNAASFLQAFDAPLPTLANASPTRHELVQGAVLGSSTTLNLASGDGDQTLGGDATDGLALYSQSNRNGNTYYYAGIFSSTDLGLPRTETEGTAMWSGRFRAIGSHSDNRVNKDFTLTVNFGEGDQAGTISARVSTTSSSYEYSLTGDFDNNGVIRGDIRFVYTSIPSYTTPGRLRGLIGQEGAVGVFVSNNDGIGNYRYSGGFVARPPSE